MPVIILNLSFSRCYADICYEGKAFCCDWPSPAPLPDIDFIDDPNMLFRLYFDNLNCFKYRKPNKDELRFFDIGRQVFEAGRGQLGIYRLEEWFLRMGAPEETRCYYEGSEEYNILSAKLAKDLL